MWADALLLFCAAAAAGAVNSVAGGGTLLTFPALLHVYGGMAAARTANATSTVAVWPGAVSSWWGYRHEVREAKWLLVPLVLMGLAGGVLGAFLLIMTPPGVFSRIVPFLVLGATLLFMGQETISRWLRRRGEELPAEPQETARRVAPGVLLMVFGTAVYGGYFGAGIGIITLAALSFIGLRDIHQMNGLKNVFAVCVNGIAAVIFMARGMVDWRWAGLMALGSIFGGYAGAGIARRIGQRNVRRLVVLVGFGLTISLLRR